MKHKAERNESMICNPTVYLLIHVSTLRLVLDLGKPDTLRELERLQSTYSQLHGVLDVVTDKPCRYNIRDSEDDGLIDDTTRRLSDSYPH
jgi:hypothetical protein